MFASLTGLILNAILFIFLRATSSQQYARVPHTMARFVLKIEKLPVLVFTVSCPDYGSCFHKIYLRNKTYPYNMLIENNTARDSRERLAIVIHYFVITVLETVNFNCLSYYVQKCRNIRQIIELQVSKTVKRVGTF